LVRRLPTIAALLGLLVVALCVTSSAAGAVGSAVAKGDAGEIHIVKVSGLLDPVLTDFVSRSLREAEDHKAVGVVLQLNSTGAVVSDARLNRLARQIHDSRVPVAIWVGPSGAKAKGRSAQLLGVASNVAVAPGSKVGQTGDVVIDRALLRPEFRARLAELHDHTLGYESAKKDQVATLDGPVLGELIVRLPGVKTKKTVVANRERLEPTTTPVFSQLPIGSQLFHTVASPSVAYLMFLIGMVLIVLELFTAGVGVAGLVGAGCFVLGCYGLGVLPANGWGIGLLVFSMFGFSIDIQTGVPRVWTGIAAAALIVGSFTIYDGMSVPWLTMAVGIVGTALFMFAGLPALVRSRFSTPTIGREWMIGQTGEAVVDVSPEGVVRVDGGLWRARANRATPIKAGEPIRVAEVQGLLLRVESPADEVEEDSIPGPDQG
jgi:membrane-bound serine protease (ClpP class)